jgi:hypothetical protein
MKQKQRRAERPVGRATKPNQANRELEVKIVPWGPDERLSKPSRVPCSSMSQFEQSCSRPSIGYCPSS